MPNTPPIQTALTGDMSGLDKALTQAQAKVGQLGTGMQQRMAGATSSINPLREAFRTLAAQATGVSPALLRITDVLGSMAVGGPLVLAATAGIVAIGMSLREGSKDWADYKKNADEAVESLIAMGKEGAFSGTFAMRQKQAMGRKRQEELVGEMRPFLIAAGRLEMSDFARKGLVDREIMPRMRKWQEIEAGIVEQGKKAEEAAGKVDGLNAELAVLTERLTDVTRHFPTAEHIMNSAMVERLGRNVDMSRSFSLAGPGASGIDAAVAGMLGRAGVNVRSSLDPNNLGGIRFPDMDQMTRSAGRKFQVLPPAEDFSRAGQIFVDTLGAMGEAAISGSRITASAVTGMLQSIVANLKTSSGGLFGATLPGALVGAGIGIVGALFGRSQSREPAKVRIDSLSSQARREMAEAIDDRPFHITQVIETGGVEQGRSEYTLRRRQRRDAVTRYVVGGLA